MIDYTIEVETNQESWEDCNDSVDYSLSLKTEIH